MFFVLNKEKIKSYLVSVSTVAILLVMSVIMQNSPKTEQTSSTIIKMPVCKVQTDENMVALTINCIKNMNNIDNILDTLSKTKSKATFFVTGEIVDKYPQEIKKIVDNGNEIGNLCNNYVSLKKLNRNEILEQFDACNKKIEKLINEEPVLARSPYGEYNNTIIETIQGNNMEIIGWNVDTLDYNELTSDEIIERINENISNGSIILMHNEYINNDFEKILNNIKEKKYEIKAISEIMYKKQYIIDNSGVQKIS